MSRGPLIRLLDIQPNGTPHQEHALVHREAAQAALIRLDELAIMAAFPDHVLTPLRAHYVHKVATLTAAQDGAETAPLAGHEPLQQQLQHEVLSAERATIIRLRDQGQIDDETLRLVERELDIEEQRWQ